MEEKKYIGRREQAGFLVGLSGQNMVYSLIGASFFTYFMTDIALFPALVVSVLLIVMKVWDGVNDPIVGSLLINTPSKTAKSCGRFCATPRCR